MKVSAVNNYAPSNLHFESRKTKDVQKPAHTTNPLSAIPLALLIAMSPVNAQVPTGPREAKQVEYSIPEENEIVARFPFKNATPDGTTGLISVQSSDNNEKVVELHLSKHIPSYAIDVNDKVVDAYRLREIEIVPEELFSRIETKSYTGGSNVVKKTYYVVGSGTEYTNPPEPIDKNIKVVEVSQPIVSKVEHGKYEISESLYKYLKDLLRGKIEINEEKNSTFIIEGRRK